MKLRRSILLGSAAGLIVTAEAGAADIPPPLPLSFVRLCSAHGAGFFSIPGTDTCLRISGRARAEYNNTRTRAYSASLVSGHVSGFSGLGRLAADARTETGYGPLRTLLRFDLVQTGGGYLTSGTAARFGMAIPGIPQEPLGRAQTRILLDKAFIQFAGVTAGRAASFYDFYAHDLELIGVSSSSDNPAVNLLAYTASFGAGLSATLSVEEPLARRQPVFSNANFTSGALRLVNRAVPPFPPLRPIYASTVPVAFDPLTGLPTLFAAVDVQQRQRVPDLVGVVRKDAAWGAWQLSGSVHEISVGKYQPGLYTAIPGGAGARVPGTPFLFPGTATDQGVAVAPGALVADAAASLREPGPKYGFAVQGGVKIDLRMITEGDLLWLQAAFGHGAMSYTGVARLNGYQGNTGSMSGRFVVNMNDAVVFANGRMKLVDTQSLTAAFLHYWTPQWRQTVFGSYGEVRFPPGSRGSRGPLVTSHGAVATSPANLGAGPASTVFVSPATAALGQAAARNALALDPTLRDYGHVVLGTGLIYSPVRDLDIGVELLYSRIGFLKGSVEDSNKFGLGGRGGAVTLTDAGGTIDSNAVGLAPGTPLRTVDADDVFITRLRIQRDF